MPRCPARLERLDDHHRRTAARAGMRRFLGHGHRCCRRIGVCRLRCRLLDRCCCRDQLSCPRQRVRLGAAAGEQAVMADAMEAFRQDVEQEASHELARCERHGRVFHERLDPACL